MVLAHVAVAVARELDDPLALVVRGRLVADRARRRDVEHVPARVAQALAEVDLVGEDEERGVEVADRLGGVAAHEQRGRLHPVDAARSRLPRLCTTKRRCSHSAVSSAVSGPGKRHADGSWRPAWVTSVAPATAASGSRVERLVQRHRRARLELGVVVEQQHVAPAGAPQQRRVVLALAAPLLERDHLGRRAVRARGARGAVARGVVEHDHLGLERHRGPLARDRVQAVAQELALLGVDHAVGELDRHGRLSYPSCGRSRLPQIDDERGRAGVVIARQRTQLARVGEAGAQRHRARRRVVAMDQDLDRSEAEAPRAAQSRSSDDRPRGDAAPAGAGGDPVADLAVAALGASAPAG